MRLEAVINDKISEVCPNDGMSFPKIDDKKTWLVRFKREATDDQKKQAQEIIDNFEWDDIEKEKAKLKELVSQYKDDLLYRKFFKEYKDQKPSASFEDFIRSLRAIQV